MSGGVGAGTALRLDDVHGYYGKSHILQGVSLEVRSGEIVCLLGRNGAGKTSTLRSVSGLLPPRSGRVTFGGAEIAGWAPHRIAKAGLCLVPEDRGIFGLLTVEENLRIAVRKGSPWSIRDVYRIFPRLEERRRNGGAQLSGGEQQMLSIARALIRDPSLILLDEPFEGLAPLIVQDLVELTKRLAADGRTIVVVEQNVAAVLSFADRVYGFNNGHVVYEGRAADLRADAAPMRGFMGLAA